MLAVASVHLKSEGAAEAVRAAQLRYLIDSDLRNVDTSVIAGDFNMPEKSEDKVYEVTKEANEENGVKQRKELYRGERKKGEGRGKRGR